MARPAMQKQVFSISCQSLGAEGRGLKPGVHHVASAARCMSRSGWGRERVQTECQLQVLLLSADDQTAAASVAEAGGIC